MNANLENAMRQISATEGVLACGLRSSDGMCRSFSSHEDLENGQLNSVWNHMMEAVKAFGLRRFPVAKMNWKFGKCHLSWFVREDGLAMGIMVEPTVQDSLSALEAWFQNFQADEADEASAA